MKHELKIIATVRLDNAIFYKADKEESIKLHIGDSVHITYPDGEQKLFVCVPTEAAISCAECGVRINGHCILTCGEDPHCALDDPDDPVAIIHVDKLLEEI